MAKQPQPTTEPDSVLELHNDAGYQELVSGISALVGQLNALTEVAVEQCRRTVEAIEASRSRDASRIEPTLDQLLDHCGNTRGLELFRRLCRYYYFINPAAAAEYVLTYRDLWEHDEDEELKMENEAD